MQIGPRIGGWRIGVIVCIRELVAAGAVGDFHQGAHKGNRLTLESAGEQRGDVGGRLGISEVPDRLGYWSKQADHRDHPDGKNTDGGDDFDEAEGAGDAARQRCVERRELRARALTNGEIRRGGTAASAGPTMGMHGVHHQKPLASLTKDTAPLGRMRRPRTALALLKAGRLFAANPPVVSASLR